MRFELFGKRMYVILAGVGEKKVGSVWIPDKHSEQSRIGTVIGVGKDTRTWWQRLLRKRSDGVTKYRVGDRILVSYYSGVTVNMPEMAGKGDLMDTHRIMVEDEILAAVRDD